MDKLNGTSIPEVGKFSLNFSDGEDFTLSPLVSTADDWTGQKYVFLKYTVKRPLRLLQLDEFLKLADEYKLDGYFCNDGINECVVILRDPRECLYEQFVQLEYAPLFMNTSCTKTLNAEVMLELERNRFERLALSMMDVKRPTVLPGGQHSRVIRLKIDTGS